MKRLLLLLTIAVLTSPPAWGRGLKHALSLILQGLIGVAPRVGAWIETERLA